MIPIIDTGHGYNTPGKRSEGFYGTDGKVLLKENSVNEAVGNKLSYIFWKNNRPAHFISNEWNDISLQERVNREHKLATDETLFISIHADAFDSPGPRGGRFFYHSESGKKIAHEMTNYLRLNGYDLELRDPMKANFKVLRDTKSTAVLFEMGFMTTKSDLDQLLTDEFRNKTAQLLYNAIQNLTI